MTDFDVGDLVEVTAVGPLCEIYFSKGNQGIITEVSNYDVLIDFNGHAAKVFGEGIWYVDRNNIKLIRKGK